MLSKKMTVSLMSLITLLALAFVVPSAMAHNPDADNFHVKHVDRETFDHRGTSLNADDVVTGFNVVVRPNPEVAQYTLTGAGALDITPININLDVEFEHAVGELDVDNNTATPQITWIAFNSVGEQVGTGTGAGGIVITDVDFGSGPNDYPFRTASNRRLRVALTPATQTTPTANPDRGEVTRIVIEFAQIPTIDPTITAVDDMSSVSGTVDITVHQPTTQDSSTATADFDTPRVVSIQRLRPGSQTVVAAFQEAAVAEDFDVRIVLSERPAAFTIDDHINVTGGEAVAGSLVAGAPFSREGDVPADIFAPTRPELLDTTRPHPIEGMYEHSLAGVSAGAFGSGPVPYPTGDDLMYHQYRVRISPYQPAATYDRPDPRVVITINAFHDGDTPYNNYYQPGVNAASTPNGREKLDLPIAPSLDPRNPGLELPLPDPHDAKIPENGFYLLVRNKNNSGIDWSEEEDRSDRRKVENVATKQTPVQLLYNVRASDMLPNLETFLVNNGTIELVAYGASRGRQTTLNLGDIYISEVMWGSDAGLGDPRESQWIEIATSGPGRDIGDSRLALHFYAAHETPPEAYVREETGALGRVIDRIGTKASDTGLGWSIAGKGQSGRTSVDPGVFVQLPIAERDRLISMYRVMDADGTPDDGTLESTWMQATGPAVNFQLPVEGTLQGYHIGTPGSAEFITPDETAAADESAQAAVDAAAAARAAEQSRIANTGTYPMAGDGRVYISEVMFAGGGTLPQWIEISNGDRSKAFNLSGWTITVDNAIADTDVSISSGAKFTIPNGTTIDPSAQDDTPSTILVVTETGRNNLTGAKASGQIVNLAVDNEIDLITAGVLRGKYTLLSDMAFLITLAPPEPAATKPPAGETAAAKTLRQANEKRASVARKAATDMVGNLGADGTAAWALPMSEEGGRSSIIRKHIQVARGPAAPEDGMMEENWVLASKTSFAQVTHIRASSYYGAANDSGTPGFRAGGALPVELSHFRPVRDKETGQVMITWATQSELNNAGFFIKRSQQADGEFKVINATMVPGAGTTSEKQFYTYTDTTAQPNVVYYYQIEDVSLDGNHQTLTRGIRLKGHIGAAGKLTATWGELKSSNE